MIISYRVWTTTRAVPLLPLFSAVPSLPRPLDKCLFGAMLTALVVAFWFYRTAVMFFLAAGFFAYSQDQNRGQPWMYMYWVMLLLTLCPERAATAACRLAISIAYIWGGIQKLQPAFFDRVPEFFVEPAKTRWHLPGLIVQLLSWFVSCAPLFEFFIGVFLWTTRLRKAAIFAAVLVHLTALLFLGPLGRNYNAVVWPWNVAMIVMIVALFVADTGTRSSGADEISPSQLSLSFWENLKALRQSWPAVGIITLYGILPFLSYIGMWDSYFSFTLYANNQAKADFYVSEAFANRLPPGMRAHVIKLREESNPEIQAPYVFEFQGWGMQELSVPPLQEPRNFLCVFNYLRRYSRDSADLRMIIQPRYGTNVFYQGDFHIPIPPSSSEQ